MSARSSRSKVCRNNPILAVLCLARSWRRVRYTAMSSEPAHSLIAPWLTVRNGERALRFYQEAFGAMVVYRLENAGKGLVARLSVEGAEFWLSDGQPGKSGPESLGGGSVRMILTVGDPDRVFARALSAGASEVVPVGDAHGWRLGRVV